MKMYLLGHIVTVTSVFAPSRVPVLLNPPPHLSHSSHIPPAVWIPHRQLALQKKTSAFASPHVWWFSTLCHGLVFWPLPKTCHNKEYHTICDNFNKEYYSFPRF